MNSITVEEEILNNDCSYETQSKIIENGVEVDGKYTNFIDMNERFTDKVEYQYHIADEGKYHISLNAEDNAGNDNSDELQVHIDKENPVISKFVFGEQEDLGSEIAKTTYRYYFKE